MTIISVPPPVESFDSNLWKLNASETQLADRRALRTNLDTAFGVFGGEEIDWSKRDHRKVAVDLYGSLNNLLSQGNDRFILYCPFNIVPRAEWYRQHDDAVDQFAELYSASWSRLLSVHDIRNNFINGDVPDPNRVVKAAHLVPVLAERGMISQPQIKSLLNDSDEVLVSSIQEALDGIKINAPDFNYDGDNEGRRIWLDRERRNFEIEQTGKIIAAKILKGQNPAGRPREAVVGIRSAIEQADHDTAVEIYNKYKPALLSLKTGEPDYVAKAMCRLNYIGIVDQDTLDEWGIHCPDLSGPFYKNLPFIDRSEERELIQDDELIKFIYSAFISCGSKLKGYGDADSDDDVAVLIRPEVPLEKREQVAQLLKSKFGHDVLSYWLREDGDKLVVHDFDDFDSRFGNSYDTNVLIGGAWEGEIATLSTVGHKLLSPYIECDNKQVREVWVGELEHDSLQYRLLHRGYKTYRTTRCDDVFMDHGYRETAAKLYASRVFIPEVN